jgi:hypothetical protein
MEGLATYYASSSSDSSDEDNVENNARLKTVTYIGLVQEVKRSRPKILSSVTLEKLPSQKEQKYHVELTLASTSNGFNNHPGNDTQQQQHLDQKNHASKKARRGIVRFITLEESNTSKKVHENKTLFVRSQPHVPGNWAGHVFVKLAPHASSSAAVWQEAEAKGLDRIRNRLESSYNGSSCVVVVHEPMNWHVSLSRPFYLQAAFIDSFVKELGQSLATSAVATSRTVRILPHECTLLVNDDKTRSFWVWPVQPSLEDLVRIVDRVLLLYKQPTYYQPAHFHISVASVPEDLSNVRNSNDNINTTENESVDDEEEDDASLYARITEVHCVIGNKSFSFPLKY